MSSSTGLDPAISSVLAAKDNALRTQISYAVAGKQLDAAKQQGAAVNDLLAQAAQLSKSLTSGHGFDGVG
ncbi:MAG TPA: hypothetical protein VL096_13050 [Pirellulaceae bacterium]|nr:hypothetical protein [Pirellulaceae bacterium]